VSFLSISSSANPLLKDVRRALLRGTLTSGGLCAAESFHLLREALRSKCRVESVLAAESARASIERQFPEWRDLNIALVPDQLFSSLSTTEASQGLIALVEPPTWRIEQLFQESGVLLVLDGIQDPGNAGTIVRTAEAFAASGVMFLKGSVSPFNAKTLRASAGSLFRLPFISSLEPAIARAGILQHRLHLYAAMPRVRKQAGRPELRRPCAIVIGNEGRGISDEFRDGAEAVVIPTSGVESLNASVAAAILLYEAFRQ
jgi:TrmH family RNA methyltransferase